MQPQQYYCTIGRNSPLEGWQTKSDGVESSKKEQLPLFNYFTLPKNKNLKEKAKDLRKAGNLSEVIFWKTFKNKELLGWDIDRQVIIGNYIVDFIINELGLVFEIDGYSHNLKGEYDLERDKYLKSLNLEIIHFRDIEIKKDIENVKKSVKFAIEKRINDLRKADD